MKNELLEVGAKYLLATRYDQKEDWYTIIAHPNARMLLTNDPSLTEEQLRTIAQRNEKVKLWKRAYPNERLDEPISLTEILAMLFRHFQKQRKPRHKAEQMKQGCR